MHCNILNIRSLVKNLIFNCSFTNPQSCSISLENIQCTFRIFTANSFKDFIYKVCDKFSTIYDICLRSSLSPETDWTKVDDLPPSYLEKLKNTAKFLKLVHRKTKAVIQIRYTFTGSSIVSKCVFFLDFIKHLKDFL